MHNNIDIRLNSSACIIYNSPRCPSFLKSSVRQCSMAPSLLDLVCTSVIPVHLSVHVQIHFHSKLRNVPCIFHIIEQLLPRGICVKGQVKSIWLPHSFLWFKTHIQPVSHSESYYRHTEPCAAAISACSVYGY